MRLVPEKETARKLFLLSGNQCAFPNCENNIIDSEDNYIGEFCHIEAANPGGERYNPNQTDKERRASENLILLCRNHHKVTNDIHKYTVTRLKEIKNKHESKFQNNQYKPSKKVISQLIEKLNIIYQNNTTIERGDQHNYHANNMSFHNNKTFSEEKDFGIIKEIFDFIFKNKLARIDIEEIKKSDKLTHLTEKLMLNFSDDQLNIIDEMIIRLWDHKSLVGKFVQIEEEDNGGRINALIDKIQSDFRKVKQANTHYKQIEDVNIIEEIAIKYLPDNRKDNPDYIANAKAIMLYFFEHCDFGKRTKKENFKQTSLFDL